MSKRDDRRKKAKAKAKAKANAAGSPGTTSDEVKLDLIRKECKGLKGDERAKCVDAIASGALTFHPKKEPAAAAR